MRTGSRAADPLHSPVPRKSPDSGVCSVSLAVCATGGLLKRKVLFAKIRTQFASLLNKYLRAPRIGEILLSLWILRS